MLIENPHFIYINSRDRESGTDENFTYNVAFPPGLEFTHVVPLNCLIPKAYYLIQDGPLENIFILEENTVQVTISVPIGSYLMSAFKKTVSDLLTIHSPNGLTYTMTYPSTQNGPDTGKWTYSHNDNTGLIQSVIITNEHFYEPLGMPSNSRNAFTGTTMISPCVIKLQSEDRLIVHSNIADNPTNDDILISINSTTSINYSSIAWECPAPEFYAHRLSSKYNNTYNFSLTDENGELIHLNGLNMNLTLLFYKDGFQSFIEQLRGFMKLALLKEK